MESHCHEAGASFQFALAGPVSRPETSSPESHIAKLIPISPGLNGRLQTSHP
jgi:hypothetical protein